MIKNRLISTGIFIEMGVIEIEYELNKINVINKSDEEPYILPSFLSSQKHFAVAVMSTAALWASSKPVLKSL